MVIFAEYVKGTGNWIITYCWALHAVDYFVSNNLEWNLI